MPIHHKEKTRFRSFIQRLKGAKRRACLLTSDCSIINGIDGPGFCTPEPLDFSALISRQDLCTGPTHSCIVLNQWDVPSVEIPSVLISALATAGVIVSAHHVTSLVRRESNVLESNDKLSMRKMNTG